jgi:SAM-dependent methyltransferase
MARKTAGSALSRDEVVAAYRLLFGREPESEAVIEQHQKHSSVRELMRTFVGSCEFKNKNWDLFFGLKRLDRLHQSPVVEVTASVDDFQKMIDRISDIWNKLGELKPHWSVLSSDEFSPDKIAQNAGAFYFSGGQDVSELTQILANLGRRPEEFEDVLEFGCGLGRLTNALAQNFRHVVGVDISSPHLKIAQEHSSEIGRGNIDYCLARFPNFGMHEEFDLWFSILVLQHNPPPIMGAILSRAFTLLRPGGMAVFQIPTFRENYQFRVADYLAMPPSTDDFEMHAFPKREIFALAEACGCVVKDNIEHDRTGPPWLSEFFVIEKPKSLAIKGAS